MADNLKNISKTRRSNEDNRVRVAVRCRPLSEKEKNAGYQAIVDFEGNHRIIVHDVSPTASDLLGTNSGERRNTSHVYDFDAVFGYESSQEDVYNESCRSIVDSVLEGFNGTIFAYGQTGTGKTYTMEGGRTDKKDRRKSNAESSSNSIRFSSSRESSKPSSAITGSLSRGSEALGIIPRSFKQIFEHVANNKQIQFVIQVSYLELYQEELRDLLKKDATTKLELHERPDTGVYVKNLSSVICKSVNDIQRIMRIGNQNRTVGATDMNEHSSRSHAIFMITIEQQMLNSLSFDDQQEASRDEPVIRVGKLNLVDLAGSERQRKTNSLGQRQKESIKINLSLAALGNVINSLMRINNSRLSNNVSVVGQVDGFTPYRDSKLTRLLQDSLGGNSKTLMIANIGPASYNYDETINTLNYASKAKSIRNTPRLNEDPKDALLTELRSEIKELKIKLASMNILSRQSEKLAKEGSKRGSIDKGYSSSTSSQDSKKLEAELVDLRNKLSGLESKLLNGVQQGSETIELSQGLLEAYTKEQALELEKSKAELLNQKSKEDSMRGELERRETAELLAKQSYSSIQQEVEAKKRLIRQILVKVKAVRADIETTQSASRLELDDLDQLQYNLQKELKLKCLIMDNFIPNEHVDQLLPRIVYDDKRSLCMLNQIELFTSKCNMSLNDYPSLDQVWTSAEADFIRPRSEFERLSEAIDSSDIRFKCINVIEPKLYVVELEPCPRFLPEHQNKIMNESESFSSKIQAIIDNSLNEHEPDIVIE